MGLPSTERPNHALLENNGGPQVGAEEDEARAEEECNAMTATTSTAMQANKPPRSLGSRLTQLALYVLISVAFTCTVFTFGFLYALYKVDGIVSVKHNGRYQ